MAKFSVELPFRYNTNHPLSSPGSYWLQSKTKFFTGEILPKNLEQFLSEDYSLGHWVEDELNGKQGRTVTPLSITFKPHAHQIEDGKLILKSFINGNAGFILANATGVGKTLSAIVGLCAIAKKQGFKKSNKMKVLILCPKGVIPVWQQTIKSFPLAMEFIRPLIINYESAGKLVAPPKNSKTTKNSRQRTKNREKAKLGTPLIDFNIIVADEAHAMKNYPSSAISMLFERLAKLDASYEMGKSPFVIYSTATPGATPLNFAIMARVLSPLLAPHLNTAKVGPKEWGEFLLTQGFSVTKGKTGWNWVQMPWGSKNDDRIIEAVARKQREDSLKIGKALYLPNSPFIKRSPEDIAGWPKQQIIMLPVSLDYSQRELYEVAWTAFKNFLKLTPAKRDPKSALVQQLRYRQKTDLLKVDGMVAQIKDWVDDGYQVYVSTEFMETVDEYARKLNKIGIATAEITGRVTGADRERERIKFQKGEAKVVLCTVVAGISLHAEESLSDGSKASSAKRITVISSTRQNPLDCQQSLGRAHRDGQNSLVYFPFLRNTVDEKVVSSYTKKISNMKHMLGESDADFLENLFLDAVS